MGGITSAIRAALANVWNYNEIAARCGAADARRDEILSEFKATAERALAEATQQRTQLLQLRTQLMHEADALPAYEAGAPPAYEAGTPPP